MARWPLIEHAMDQKILCVEDLENSIKTYNQKIGKLELLRVFFTSKATLDERTMFFDETLPKMQKLLLNMPNVVTAPPKLLKRGINCDVYLTQEQCAHILVCAFFCAFPRRNKAKYAGEYDNFNIINFDKIFKITEKSSIEKLRTLLNYFNRITTEMPNGVISFERRCQKTFPEFETANDKLNKILVKGSGVIETEGADYVQVDFANKFIGGGALGWGCVQEEIRFMICPELIVSMLLTEVLEDDECLIMTGAECYSEYSGYGSEYKFKRNYKDLLPRDNLQRKITQIVAMDAEPYYEDKESQYTALKINRDLKKAYISFKSTNPEATIATGNWGCGAFRGDPEIKFILQLMAAAIAKRPLVYFTCDHLMKEFSGEPLSEKLIEIQQIISHHPISDIYQRLMEYEPECGSILDHFRHPDYTT